MKKTNFFLEELRCTKCNSKQIRTTKDFRICNRCGHKEKIDGNI